MVDGYIILADYSCTHNSSHPHIDLTASGYDSDSVCTTNTTKQTASGTNGELWATMGASFPILWAYWDSGRWYFDPDYNATGGTALAQLNFAWGYNGSQAVVLVAEGTGSDPWWAWDMNDRGLTHHP